MLDWFLLVKVYINCTSFGPLVQLTCMFLLMLDDSSNCHCCRAILHEDRQNLRIVIYSYASVYRVIHVGAALPLFALCECLLLLVVLFL